MSDLMTLHNTAMDLAFLGDRKKSAGEEEEAKELYHQAFEAEKEAALLAESQNNPEPGLSILFRSAATLALRCGELREAERLATNALSGSPDDRTADELRDILQQIYSMPSSLPADTEQVAYELYIPKSETSLFYTIIKRMGWSAARFKGSMGKIAVL